MTFWKHLRADSTCHSHFTPPNSLPLSLMSGPHLLASSSSSGLKRGRARGEREGLVAATSGAGTGEVLVAVVGDAWRERRAVAAKKKIWYYMYSMVTYMDLISWLPNF